MIFEELLAHRQRFVDREPLRFLGVVASLDLRKLGITAVKFNQESLCQGATTQRTVGPVEQPFVRNTALEHRCRNLQPGFFLQFTEHCLNGSFVLVQEAARKCPKTLAWCETTLDK